MSNANIPFDRYVRKGRKLPGAVPSVWMPRPRIFRGWRGSRRGMGHRGFMRFFVPASPAPIDAKAQTRLEQPTRAIRTRATGFVQRAVAKVRGAVGKFFGR